MFRLFRLALFIGLMVSAEAIRFHDLTDRKTHFHGVPVEKYVSSMNRIQEIEQILQGSTEPPLPYEEIDWNTDDSTNPRVNPFMFDGDMVLSEDQLDALVESYEVQLANKEGRSFNRLFGVGNPAVLWTHFPIPWTISTQNPSYGGYDPIRRGIELWEDHTCLTFAENGTTPTTTRGLEFFDGGGCYSSVGRRPIVNKISITRGCHGLITVAHEVGHALGLFHMQNRFDADQYIDFIKPNIDPNETAQFDPPHRYFIASNHGLPYDYGSAMQYDRFSFGLRPNLPTMLPKDRNYNATLGEDFELSFTDAKEINMMYCDNVCPRKLQCLNGGYTDPKDCTKCRCPAGLSGRRCQRLADSTPGCGQKIRTATSKFQTLSASGSETCVYKIKAPRGNKIKIILDSTRFQGEMYQFLSCNDNFVEIKYADQYQTAGARFCSRQLVGTRTMISSTNEALVIYKADQPDYEFTLRYVVE